MVKKILLFGLMFLAVNAFAEERTITVKGKGDARVTPDIVYLFAGAETLAKTPGEAIKQNSVLIEGLKKKIVSYNINLERVKTANFYMYKDATRVDQKEVFLGYRITNVLEIPVEEVSRAGDVLDGLIAEGANVVQGIEYGLKDRKSIETAILKQAVSNAKVKAEDIAGSVGCKLGKVLSIKESYSSPAFWGAEGGAMELSAGPFVPGQLKVEGIVEVTYSLAEVE